MWPENYDDIYLTSIGCNDYIPIPVASIHLKAKTITTHVWLFHNQKDVLTQNKMSFNHQTMLQHGPGTICITNAQKPNQKEFLMVLDMLCPVLLNNQTLVNLPDCGLGFLSVFSFLNFGTIRNMLPRLFLLPYSTE